MLFGCAEVLRDNSAQTLLPSVVEEKQLAITVTSQRESLPDLNEVGSVSDLQTNWSLYLVLVVTALLFGCAEVLRDNSAQTLLPSVVEEKQLESANGKMWWHQNKKARKLRYPK